MFTAFLNPSQPGRRNPRHSELEHRSAKAEMDNLADIKSGLAGRERLRQQAQDVALQPGAMYLRVQTSDKVRCHMSPYLL